MSPFHFGLILRAKLEFEDKTSRNKFLIVLGEDVRAKDILFFITTSRVEKIPIYGPSQGNVIYIRAGEIVSFTHDTVIDCRTVYKRTRKWFDGLHNKSLLTEHGDIPKETHDRIKQVVFNSAFISQSDRKIILA